MVVRSWGAPAGTRRLIGLREMRLEHVAPKTGDAEGRDEGSLPIQGCLMAQNTHLRAWALVSRLLSICTSSQSIILLVFFQCPDTALGGFLQLITPQLHLQFPRLRSTKKGSPALCHHPTPYGHRAPQCAAYSPSLTQGWALMLGSHRVEDKANQGREPDEQGHRGLVLPHSTENAGQWF